MRVAEEPVQDVSNRDILIFGIFRIGPASQDVLNLTPLKPKQRVELLSIEERAAQGRREALPDDLYVIR